LEREATLELKPVLDVLRIRGQRKRGLSQRRRRSRGLSRTRGRPIDTGTVAYLGRLAEFYSRYAGKKPSVSKYNPKVGDVRWGRFIEFVHACFLAAEVNPTKVQLAKAWIRAQRRVRLKKTSP
jgi:hypothetical protein